MALELAAGTTWAVGRLGFRPAGASPAFQPRTRSPPRRALLWFSARQADSDARRLTGGAREPPGPPSAGMARRAREPPGPQHSLPERRSRDPGMGPKATSPTTGSRQGSALAHPGGRPPRTPNCQGRRVEGSHRRLGRWPASCRGSPKDPHDHSVDSPSRGRRPRTPELSWIQSAADLCPHKATSPPEGIPPRRD